MRLQRRRHAPISVRLRAIVARVARLGYDPGFATRILIISTFAASSHHLSLPMSHPRHLLVDACQALSPYSALMVPLLTIILFYFRHYLRQPPLV